VRQLRHYSPLSLVTSIDLQVVTFLGGAILLLVLQGGAARAQAPSKAGWKLSWSDEFEGAEIDATKWDFDLGDGYFDYVANMWITGWGNGELQYYTNEQRNARVDQGVLRIRALKESLHGRGYTSARLKTKARDGKTLFAQKFGRFEMRAKLPTGQGVWPAFWLLPESENYGSWASSGEIDILEAKGQQPDRIHGTIHYGSRWPENRQSTVVHVLADGGRIDQFHTYAIEWEPGEIRWYVDDVQYAKQTSWWSSSRTAGDRGQPPTSDADLNAWPAPFDQPFVIVMNLAIGGQFAGAPAAETPFPAEMIIDYVRVYESTDPQSGKIKPRTPAGPLFD
jgi:beta-glucanase (GH16 family)